MLTTDKAKRPLRVAFVITELEVGGAERCLAELAVRVDRQRFDPHVYVLASRPVPDNCGLVNQLESNSIPVHFLDGRSKLDAWKTFRKLREHFRVLQPDVVQTFLFHANVLGVMAAHSANVPRIMTGIRVADPTRWRMTVEKWVSRNADKVICVSESVGEYARRAGFDSAKIVMIPNGVDLSRFASAGGPDPLRPPIAAGKKVVTVVGRLHPQKGIDWLLRSLAPFFPAHRDVSLAIIGGGPAEGELKDLARRLELDEHVFFMGRRDDVPAILQHSDLFVLPSRWEGMANALLEAMAAGLPVIASRVEGVEEVLGPAAKGQIVEYGDDSALRESIASILADPNRAKDLRQANRERAAVFSLERVARRYEDLFDAAEKAPR